jgi:hypothetical protein
MRAQVQSARRKTNKAPRGWVTNPSESHQPRTVSASNVVGIADASSPYPATSMSMGAASTGHARIARKRDDRSAVSILVFMIVLDSWR